MSTPMQKTDVQNLQLGHLGQVTMTLLCTQDIVQIILQIMALQQEKDPTNILILQILFKIWKIKIGDKCVIVQI